jgi:hypothetical protein
MIGLQKKLGTYLILEGEHPVLNLTLVKLPYARHYKPRLIVPDSFLTQRLSYFFGIHTQRSGITK